MWRGWKLRPALYSTLADIPAPAQCVARDLGSRRGSSLGPGASRYGDEPQQPRRPASGPGRPCAARGRSTSGRWRSREGARPEHPDTATSLNNLAVLLQAQGDLCAGASRSTSARWRSARRRSAPSIPIRRASLNNLAVLLQAPGRPMRGREPLYERALAIREKALGPEHPDTATSLNNLAALLQAPGRPMPRREPLYERALAIREKALGPEHPDTATSLNNLAGLLQAQGDLCGRASRSTSGRWRSARRRSAPSIPIRRRASTTSPRCFRPRATYAEARAALRAGAGDPREGARPRASRYGDEPQQPRRSASGPGRPRGGASRSTSARWRSARRRSAPSIPTRRRASTTSPRCFRPRATYARARAALRARAGDPREGARPRASRYGDEPQQPRRAATSPGRPTRGASRSTSGRWRSARRRSARSIPTPPRASTISPSCCGQGGYAQAEPLSERALAICEKALGPEHPETATSLNNLAALFSPGRLCGGRAAIRAGSGDPGEGARPRASRRRRASTISPSCYRPRALCAGAPLYERALAIREKALGPEHPSTKIIRKNLDTQRNRERLLELRVATGTPDQKLASCASGEFGRARTTMTFTLRRVLSQER